MAVRDTSAGHAATQAATAADPNAHPAARRAAAHAAGHSRRFHSVGAFDGPGLAVQAISRAVGGIVGFA